MRYECASLIQNELGGNDFSFKLLWSHEIGATEPVIAPQSPPVNTHADKTGGGDFPLNQTVETVTAAIFRTIC